jgi:hypothetical protein
MQDKSRGRHSSTGRGKRHPRYDSIAHVIVLSQQRVVVLGELYRQSCRLHSAQLQPTEQALARSAERASGLMGNETVLPLESGGI